MKLIKDQIWAYAIMRFADVGKERNHSILLEDTLTICPDSDKKIIDDDLFWQMLQTDRGSHRFLERHLIYSLEQLMDDYNEWYEENAFVDHYQYGDDRLIYPLEWAEEDEDDYEGD